MDKLTDSQQSKMESSCSTFVPLINAHFFFTYNHVVWHVHKCIVRDCASSAKSVDIVFDDQSDVLEKTITVPSLPKENGVPVKINVIELRSPQANLFLAKMIVLDFTGVCFNAIMHPDRVTSIKAEMSVTESPGNKGIWVKNCSHKSRFSSKFVII